MKNRKKKVVSVLLTAALTAAMAVVPAFADTGSITVPEGLADGTYAATATVTSDKSFKWSDYEITVYVAVSNGAITNLATTGATGRDANFDSNAVEGISTQIAGLTAGTYSIDTVSRATCSSEAIITGISAALASEQVSSEDITGSVSTDEDSDSSDENSNNNYHNNGSDDSESTEGTTVTTDDGYTLEITDTAYRHFDNLSVTANEDGTYTLKFTMTEGSEQYVTAFQYNGTTLTADADGYYSVTLDSIEEAFVIDVEIMSSKYANVTFKITAPTGNGEESEKLENVVTKADTKIKVKKASLKKTVKAKKLKKKNVTFKIKASANSGGKITYKKVNNKYKKIKVSKNGKVTLKKGLKKGTYSFKVKIKAAATDSYKAKTVKKTVKIVVK